MNKSEDIKKKNIKPNVIKNQVNDILEFMKDPDVISLKNIDFEEYSLFMENKFVEFNKLYPTLFKMIIKGEKLDIMMKILGTIEKINTDEINQFDGEKEIGELLAEKYLYPVIGKKK